MSRWIVHDLRAVVKVNQGVELVTLGVQELACHELQQGSGGPSQHVGLADPQDSAVVVLAGGGGGGIIIIIIIIIIQRKPKPKRPGNGVVSRLPQLLVRQALPGDCRVGCCRFALRADTAGPVIYCGLLLLPPLGTVRRASKKGRQEGKEEKEKKKGNEPRRPPSGGERGATTTQQQEPTPTRTRTRTAPLGVAMVLTIVVVVDEERLSWPLLLPSKGEHCVSISVIVDRIIRRRMKRKRKSSHRENDRALRHGAKEPFFHFILFYFISFHFISSTALWTETTRPQLSVQLCVGD
jgi:hypothetical protein